MRLADPIAVARSRTGIGTPPPESDTSVGILSPQEGWARLRHEWPAVKGMWKRVLGVEAVFTLFMLPLQALSLLVVTVPFTFPRMADIQLSLQVRVCSCCVAPGAFVTVLGRLPLPLSRSDALRLPLLCLLCSLCWFASRILSGGEVSMRASNPSVQTGVLEGKEGRGALQRSRELVAGRRWAVITPVVALLVVARLLESTAGTVQGMLLVCYERGVPELPILISLLTRLVIFALQRAIDILPFVTYHRLLAEGKGKEEGAGKGQGIEKGEILGDETSAA